MPNHQCFMTCLQSLHLERSCPIDIGIAYFLIYMRCIWHGIACEICARLERNCPKGTTRLMSMTLFEHQRFTIVPQGEEGSVLHLPILTAYTGQNGAFRSLVLIDDLTSISRQSLPPNPAYPMDWSLSIQPLSYLLAKTPIRPSKS